MDEWKGRVGRDGNRLILKVLPILKDVFASFILFQWITQDRIINSALQYKSPCQNFTQNTLWISKTFKIDP